MANRLKSGQFIVYDAFDPITMEKAYIKIKLTPNMLKTLPNGDVAINRSSTELHWLLSIVTLFYAHIGEETPICLN